MKIKRFGTVLVAVAIWMVAVALPAVSHGTPQQESRDEKAKREMQAYVDEMTPKIKNAPPGAYALLLNSPEVYKRFEGLDLKGKYALLALSADMDGKPRYGMNKSLVADIHSQHEGMFDSQKRAAWIVGYMGSNQDYVDSFARAMGETKITQREYVAISMNYFRLQQEEDRASYWKAVANAYSKGKPDKSLLSSEDSKWIDQLMKKTRKNLTREELLATLFP